MQAAKVWTETDTFVKVTFAVLSILSTVLFYLLKQPGFSKLAPKIYLENLPVVGTLAFFSKRWQFFTDAAAFSATGQWAFHIGKYRVVGLSGPDGRKVFFENKLLDFAKGYAVLFGQAPTVELEEGENEDPTSSKGHNYIVTTLTQLLRKDNMAHLLPRVLKDVRSNFETLSEKPTGIINPFDTIYRHIAQVTTRTFGCDEIADDPNKLTAVLSAFKALDTSTTPMSVMYPRFPTPAVFKRFLAGVKLYKLVADIANARKKSGHRGDDPLQHLIDQGFGTDKIVGFIISALFAGMVNTGLNTSWTLCYLASNPHWMAQAREEVDAALLKHATDSELTTIESICSIPLHAWETEFPILYLCLRESIRIHMHGAAIRANFTGKDILIGKEIIPDKSFVMYHIGDVHQDPEIYPEPLEWQPGRYLPERAEDRKAHLAYLGWGAARHPCLGKNFAKMEITATLAAFVALFDFDLLDGAEKPLVEPPKINMDQWQIEAPATPVKLSYKRRADAKF